MNLLRLLGRLGPKSLRRLLLGAAGSALCSTLVLAIVNHAAQDIAENRTTAVNYWLAGLFAAGVLFYTLTESWMVARMSADMEEAVDNLRMRLLEQIRAADLWKLECFGQTRLFESITQNSKIISANSQFLAQTIRSLFLAFTIMIYIAILSPIAFMLISILLGGGTLAYLTLGRELEDRQKGLMDVESGLFEGVSDLFDGFKEQRLNSARSDDLAHSFATISRRTVAAREGVHELSWHQFVFGETAFNLMLGVVVFVVPGYSTTFGQDLVKLAAAVIFLATPVFGLMQFLAVMRTAEGAAGRMLELEQDLVGLVETGGNEPPLPVADSFREIRLEGVGFSFPAPAGERPFSVGPFDVAIRRGDVIFVTGGNGSGKSTFIKLLTRLYVPGYGRLRVDDQEISARHVAGYRGLMATVFADFHLFTRLYGLTTTIDATEAANLMHWVEMERVTTLSQGQFGRRDLSAGQRKRLGLVAALLEHKPVLILDEWAADQDPEFRSKFYHEIIPTLNKEYGLTIIAVTHDEDYFHVASRRWHMEEGRLVELPVMGGVA